MIYLEVFLTFLKIGAFTFGGGYAMLPFMQQEVLANNWMNEEELLNFIAVAESTPGPIAINLATYVGYKLRKIPGALIATIGMIIPSFLYILMPVTVVSDGSRPLKKGYTRAKIHGAFFSLYHVEEKLSRIAFARHSNAPSPI